MPFPSRRHRRKRFFKRGKRELIWVSTFVTADLQALTGDTDAFPIVTRDDWVRDPSQTDTIEKGAVVTRIIGDVRVRTQNAGATGPGPAGASYIWGIQKRDEDDTTVYDLTTNFFGEDWMHLQAGSLPPNNATTVAFAPQPNWRHERIDIGVKRKLTSDDIVLFTFGGFDATGGVASGDVLVVDYFFRTLIALP